MCVFKEELFIEMTVFSYSLLIPGSHGNDLGDASCCKESAFFFFPCSEGSGFSVRHIAIGTRCNLGTDIDVMRAKRSEEGKETSVSCSCSNGEKQRREQVREISVMAS